MDGVAPLITDQCRLEHGWNQIQQLLWYFFLFSSNRPTGPIRSSSRDVRMRVCLCVCLSVCVSVPFRVVYFEAHFAPTSRSRMSEIFRDSESLGKSAGKKWSQNWTFLLGSGLKLPRKKKFFFVADFALFCVEELVLSPSYYTRGALKTGGGCHFQPCPVNARHSRNF